MLRVREYATGLELAPSSFMSYWYYLVLLCITPLFRIANWRSVDKAEKRKGRCRNASTAALRGWVLAIFEIKFLAASHGSGGLEQSIKGICHAIRRRLVLHSPVFSNTQAARLLGNIDIGT